MIENIDIRNLYLGRTKAESERLHLNNYFVSTNAYRNAKEERKRKLFYIAHRGSGKSALFNQLSFELSSKKNNIIVQISPSEYSYETFTNLKHSFYDVKASYSLAWEYTLIVQLFLEVSKYFKANPNVKRNRENIKIIDDFLLRNKFIESQTRLELFLDFLSRIDLTKLNIEYKGFKVSGDAKTNAAKKLVSLYNLDEIRKPLGALEQITFQHPIYIFIDELDTGWNNTKEAKNFISGLITGSIRINNLSGIKVFLSLRQDMYNNLSSAFDDTEKIRDEIEFLEWDKDLLIAIICNRIKDNPEVRNNFEHLNYASHNEILGVLFEENTFDYLLSGTLNRPREVIHYCNLSIAEFSKSYLSKKLFGKKINNEIIDIVSKHFSRDRYYDFCAEFNHEYPEIKSFLDNFEGADREYTKDLFLDKLEECILYFDEKHIDLDWTHEYFDNTNKLLIRLFEIGFIKISITDSNSFFAYFEKQPQNFNNVKFVQINKVFANVLDCQEKNVSNVIDEK
ncbi:P-loop ATPase, Sll1717 family [Aquimarina algiphila]|uniref:P-loop ATPase, Sll1717 family n=1 Tax=Aquimarina algiphila TaxID=2047982 RepID=UPI00232BBAFE|nr:hypothetical protein [Aquimarina algiphila]